MTAFLERYPFQTVLSLEPLITALRRDCEGISQSCGALLEKIEQVDELRGPIKDLSVLDRHQGLLRELLHQVVSVLSWQTEAVAAVVPFSMEPVAVSPLFARLFTNGKSLMQGEINLKQEDFEFGRIIRAYLFILKQCFQIDETLQYPMVRTVRDPETGQERYYRMELDFRYVQARPLVESSRELNSDERSRLVDALTDPETMKALLPPENYEICGLTLIRMLDVTQSEVLSLLQRDLIDQDSMTTWNGFQQIQNRLRTLFQKPDLISGIAALSDDQVLLLNTGCDMVQNCIFANSRHIPQSEFVGSPFEQAVDSGRILRIKDIHHDPWFLEKGEQAGYLGVRSLLIAPLLYQGQCVGTMDLGLPDVNGFGPMSELLLEQLRPIFALTVKKSLDELDHQIEGVIKQECTAIHPAVEWRFRKAALQHLEDVQMGRNTEIEPIVFQDVFPLYGVADIRGSSQERNQAIESDLTEHLNLARNVLLAADQIKPMLLVQEMLHRLEGYQSSLSRGLDSGEDLSVIDFVSREVEPLFPLLQRFGTGVREAVETYQAALDPQVGTVYSLRKDFENSMALLNDRLCTFLDQEEAALQQLVPHYFERHKTDGLDYLIYLGDSLLENGGFDPAYLKNFRIWQLKAACGLAGIAEELKSSLPVPLDIAQLILIQSSPISIRFRYDEKRFDVDGAYDVRQEIIKSRLDKATVKGTGERLTQPGTIAVIYSSRAEAQEMHEHIDYLCARGFLLENAEQLKLADLPGVQGLKALRVGVDLQSQGSAS